MSATDSGLAHLPMALAVALGIGLLSRRLLPRLGTRMMTIGCFIMAAGIALVGLVVQRGGFPPVHLAEINFQAMFEQQQAEAAAAAQADTAAPQTLA